MDSKPKTLTQEQIALIEKIKRDLGHVIGDPRVLGIILYGSYATGENHARSDIDICFVTEEKNPYDLWSFIYEKSQYSLDKYDIKFLSELPIDIKGDVIYEGIVVYTPDWDELRIFLRKYKKIYDDWVYRMKRIENMD